MARDTFGPMARVDTGLLKSYNFIGPNRLEIYFGMLTARRIWASGVAKILCQGGPIDKNKITPQIQLTNAYIILQMHISRRSFKTY